MTHVHKSLWPTAFVEGKHVADHVHALNRELKAFKKMGTNEIPTDRELALGACVQIFWAYKMQQEAGAAARRITFTKLEEFFTEYLSGTSSKTNNEFGVRALRKAVRKIQVREEGEGFLRLWEKVSQFLAAAQRPEYWKQFEEDPSTVIAALAHDLARIAQQGEEENGKEEEGTGPSWIEAGERKARSERNPSEANPAGANGENGNRLSDQPGENRSAEGVRGAGEGLEDPACGVQEQHQTEAGAGGQASERSESGNRSEH